MADSKSTKKNTQTTKKSTKKPSASQTRKPSGKKGKSAQPYSEGAALTGILLLSIAGVFLIVCLLFPALTGAVGQFLHNLSRGLIGGAAYFVPLLLVIGALFFKKDLRYRAVSLKFCFGTLLTASIAVLFHTPHRAHAMFDTASAWDRLCAYYDGGVAGIGGGVLGGLLTALLGYAGLAGILIVSIAGVVFMSLFYIGQTPKSLYITIMYHIYKRREVAAARREAIAPEVEARRSQLDERSRELARMRSESAQRAAEQRRLAAEARAAAQQTGMAHRRGAIDDNIYADTADSVPISAAAPAPAERKPKKTRRDGAPVPGEVYDRGTVAAPAAAIVTVDTATGEVLSTEEPPPSTPDETAYALAADDEAEALKHGVKNEDTASHTEVLHAEIPQQSSYVPTGEIDLSAIFVNPRDETLVKKYATQSGSSDIVEQAELELTVQKRDPGADADDDTPPWEIAPPAKPKPVSDRPAMTPDGFSEIPDVVSRTQIDDAIHAGIIGTDGTAMHAQPGSMPRDEGEGEDAAALLASLNSMYGQNGNAPIPAAPGTQPEPAPYVYPPVMLLKKDTTQKSDDVAEELEANARKLTDILRSFNVKTKIVNVSRGPTITRYELQPEAGTRVRSVANLVDDIALGLAADGVRIEAPIPGKSAIGIEVPNASVSTVYIRELIDCDAFSSSKSKVTTALGMDVAGAPIYLDVSKMPHLLICGATGMGKSVCINALIVSILYKATPDEVKLILIDPKKVELNIYSGIPHLLVPVVSDPKKAAGALHWAVTEMERRFALIEDVGMRDIKGYNEITKNDPDREYLPQIVIIIDELADLMMTAPDEVEESICRLAQKARAAGMYLIIGTQRPSVDVITGLIKANIPSRIAFRVSSQMDSRVILDEVGAEKLIGRGDMLYKPVGAPKPKRVQGSFVSEDEIDNVITFLKKTAGHAEYADDVMESIEREAAMCGQKKSARTPEGEDFDGDGTPDDPMLKNAVELAVESGKISTSLIQRRLSLGYGRAAKLIDRMEQLGYVSAPEGQKPRQVLITKEQYMELVLKQGGVTDTNDI